MKKSRKWPRLANILAERLWRVYCCSAGITLSETLEILYEILAKSVNQFADILKFNVKSMISQLHQHQEGADKPKIIPPWN
jgi:hypothetical protein